MTVLRARQFEAQYKLHSDFIKALHHRFKEEGIEIPFPIRTVIVKQPGSEAGRTLVSEHALKDRSHVRHRRNLQRQ